MPVMRPERNQIVGGLSEMIKKSKINTVQDLINELQKFPTDMEVRDYDFEIEDVKIKRGIMIIIHMIDRIKIMYVSVKENN